MTAEQTPDLRGLWVPVVTPFDARGGVDLDALRRLAHRLLADGATGLVALGTTGESATLTPAERRSVVATCDEVCLAHRRPLVVGAGTNGTESTVDAIHGLAVGRSVVAALVVVPYYTRPSEPAIVEHFAVVADAVALPVVVYNVPQRTGCRLGSTALLELAGHANVAGVKQAVGALDTDTLHLLAGSGPGFQVLAGDDALIAPTLLLGGAGAVAAAAHLCTPAFVELVTAASAGDGATAAAHAAALLPVVSAGFAEPNPAVWKGALARRGELATGELRRPMTAASPAAVDRVLAAAMRVAAGS